jgi:fructose-specific phosphotransferase system component IIB
MTEDLALWIDKLKVLNKGLAGIDRRFEKNEIKKISHIMANLPTEYSEDLRLAVSDMWKISIENKTEIKKTKMGIKVTRTTTPKEEQRRNLQTPTSSVSDAKRKANRHSCVRTRTRKPEWQLSISTLKK